MNCGPYDQQIPLYLYGELPPEDEETLEQHVESCAECRLEIDRLRSMRRALDARALAPEARLLAECRQDLMTVVQQSAAPARRWGLFLGDGTSFLNPVAGLRRVAMVAACVGLGFFIARLPLRGPGLEALPSDPETDAVSPGGFFPADGTRVRSVQPDHASGRVRIGLQETRLRFVSGTPEDANIQRLLLAAAHDDMNAGLRVESIDLLKDHHGSALVKKALMDALARDPNPGVRLKALEGLKALAAESEIRKLLAHALVADDNPGVRVQVIELLTERPHSSMVGVFQDLVRKEDNQYVRMRCRRALRELNASEGTF